MRAGAEASGRDLLRQGDEETAGECLCVFCLCSSPRKSNCLSILYYFVCVREDSGVRGCDQKRRRWKEEEN